MDIMPFYCKKEERYIELNTFKDFVTLLNFWNTWKAYVNFYKVIKTVSCHYNLKIC